MATIMSVISDAVVVAVDRALDPEPTPVAGGADAASPSPTAPPSPASTSVASPMRTSPELEIGCGGGSGSDSKDEAGLHSSGGTAKPVLPAATNASQGTAETQTTAADERQEHVQCEPVRSLRTTPRTPRHSQSEHKDGFRPLFSFPTCVPSRQYTHIVFIPACNEDEDAYKSTIAAVGEEMWLSSTRKASKRKFTLENTLLLVVIDGVKKMHDSAKEYLASVQMIDNETLDMFATTEQTAAGLAFYNPKALVGNTRQAPFQSLVVIKSQNAGKAHSQELCFDWLRNTLKHNREDQIDKKCSIVQIDVGTIPRPGACTKLVERLHYSRLAGVCGQIQPRGGHVCWMFMPERAAQAVEYAMAQASQKQFEDIVGLISCVTGAFCAWSASALLTSDRPGDSPAARYFRWFDPDTITMTPKILQRNLAEDRILGIEVLTEPGRGNLLGYVHNAVADTDIPALSAKLFDQRRRWLNGTMWATLFAIPKTVDALKSSNHSLLRRFLIILKLVMDCVQLGLQFTSPAMYTLAVSVASASMPFFFMRHYATPFVVFMLMLMTALCLMGNHESVKTHLRIMTGLFSAWTAYIYVGVYLGLRNNLFAPEQMELIAGLAFAIGSLFVTTAIHGTLMKLLAVIPAAILWLPNFVVVIGTYAICHSNDIRWNSGSALGEEEKKAQGNLDRFRNRLVMGYLAVNCLVFVALSQPWSAWPLRIVNGLFYVVITINLVGSILNKLLTMLRGVGMWVSDLWPAPEQPEPATGQPATVLPATAQLA